MPRIDQAVSEKLGEEIVIAKSARPEASSLVKSDLVLIRTGSQPASRVGTEPRRTATRQRCLTGRAQEVLEHREVAGVTGDQAGGMDLRRRGDQGVERSGTVTARESTTWFAAPASDLGIDREHDEQIDQHLRPAGLGSIANADVDLGDGHRREQRFRRQSSDVADRRRIARADNR
jgi:hypothetical protein